MILSFSSLNGLTSITARSPAVKLLLLFDQVKPSNGRSSFSARKMTELVKFLQLKFAVKNGGWYKPLRSEFGAARRTDDEKRNGRRRERALMAAIGVGKLKLWRRRFEGGEEVYEGDGSGY